MITAVRKWGNSLGVRIPKNIASQIELTDGNKIELTVENNIINIKKSNQQETLESLVSTITNENKHDEIETIPSGKEV